MDSCCVSACPGWAENCACPGQRGVLVLGSREVEEENFRLLFPSTGSSPATLPHLALHYFPIRAPHQGSQTQVQITQGSKLDGSCDKKAEEQMPRSNSDRSTRNPRRCKGKNQTFRGACNLRNLGQILTSVSRICPESGQQFGNDGKGCHFGQI